MDLEMENFDEGSQKNEKEETLNKVVSEFVMRYKNHFYGKNDNFEELLQDLKNTTQEVRNLGVEQELLEKFEEYMAKALLLIFREQAKNEKPIDFEIVEEVTTPKALSVEIKNQFVQFAEKLEEIDKSLAYDVLKKGMQVSEDNLEYDTIWEAFRLFEIIDQKVNNQEKQLPAENLPRKTSFLRKMLFGKGTSKYMIGKFDEEKQEWVPVREEYHSYPPKRKMEDCIGLEINDVEEVDIRYLKKLPHLQDLTFGRKVKTVENKSRFKAENVKRIIFSDNVEVILAELFSGCGELEEVRIGDGLKQIGVMAFENCRNLKKVQLGKNIGGILWSAFEGCSSLKEINLPDSLEVLGNSAFKDCRNLAKVNFGRNLRKIGENCFAGTSIRDVGEMPFLEYIGNDAFYIFNDFDSPIHMSSTLLRGAKGKKIFRAGSYIDVDGILTIVNKDGTLRKLKKPENPGEVREKQKEGWTDKEIDEEYFNWL